jgi:hypothetical protein
MWPGKSLQHGAFTPHAILHLLLHLGGPGQKNTGKCFCTRPPLRQRKNIISLVPHAGYATTKILVPDCFPLHYACVYVSFQHRAVRCSIMNLQTLFAARDIGHLASGQSFHVSFHGTWPVALFESLLNATRRATPRKMAQRAPLHDVPEPAAQNQRAIVRPLCTLYRLRIYTRCTMLDVIAAQLKNSMCPGPRIELLPWAYGGPCKALVFFAAAL